MINDFYAAFGSSSLRFHEASEMFSVRLGAETVKAKWTRISRHLSQVPCHEVLPEAQVALPPLSVALPVEDEPGVRSSLHSIGAPLSSEVEKLMRSELRAGHLAEPAHQARPKSWDLRLKELNMP